MKGKHLLTLLLIFTLFITNKAIAQPTEDLLGLVNDDKPKKEIVKNAFKSTRVINGHSMEFLAPGTMDFRILHRFGLLDQGYQNFFGMDQATMRLGFDFGILKSLMAGIGRSTYKKEVDGFIKFAPIRQSTGSRSFPATVAIVTGMTMNTAPWADPTIPNYFTSRLAYYFQAIIGRKFSERLSIQVTPTLVHLNIVPLQTQPNDVYAVGFGGRFKFTKRMALTWDYFYMVNGRQKNVLFDPISIGIDIETGGHVFQLHVSNCTGMNERAFITETTNNFVKGQIRFGFNLSRVFQLKKVKSEK
jgi:hypothetical protein